MSTPLARVQDVEEECERITDLPDTSASDEAEDFPMRHYVNVPIISSTTIVFFGYA